MLGLQFGARVGETCWTRAGSASGRGEPRAM